MTANRARRHRFVTPALLAWISFAPSLGARSACEQIAEQAANAGSGPEADVPRPQSVESKPKFASIASDLTIGGVLDLRAATGDAEQALSSGVFELTVTKELRDRLAVSATIAANAEGASIAAAVVDARLLTRGERGSGGELDVRIGHFDVPFGNDWRSFAANDRKELSAPLTTDAIMEGGYTDTGIQFLGRRRGIEASAGVMRGSRRGPVYAGRLALMPFEAQGHANRFEGGLSVLVAAAGTNAVALDAETHAGAWRIRAEHVRKENRTLDASTVRSGWHLTAAVDAGKVAGVAMTPFARFDAAGYGSRGDNDSDGRGDPAYIRRVTAGLRADLSRLLMLKVEYTRILAAPFAVRSGEGFRPDSLTTQVVIAF